LPDRIVEIAAGLNTIEEMPMRSLVTGGTGFIGRHLISRLDRPVVLGRDPMRIHKLFRNVDAFQWLPSSLPDKKVFQGVDTVFHLAGESVSKGRWNREKKERIMRSRVDGTRNLVEQLAALDQPPATLVCASAIGFYGRQGEKILSESSPPGDDFLARVCIAWEEEASRAEKFGIRVVRIRTGIVLGEDGGALPQMLLPFRLGAGGKIGTGKQYMSWIHIDDLIGIMLHVAANESIRGPVNGVAPSPVTNSEFTEALAAALHRPALFYVPGWVLKITVGEFADVLLGSQRVVPEKITAAGYTFIYPELTGALQNLVG
jgi:uncharacterized protein (TIGR01777 family)